MTQLYFQVKFSGKEKLYELYADLFEEKFHWAAGDAAGAAQAAELAFFAIYNAERFGCAAELVLFSSRGEEKINSDNLEKLIALAISAR